MALRFVNGSVAAFHLRLFTPGAMMRRASFIQDSVL